MVIGRVPRHSLGMAHSAASLRAIDHRTADGEDTQRTTTKVGPFLQTSQFLTFPGLQTSQMRRGRNGYALIPSASDAANSIFLASTSASSAVSFTVTAGLRSSTNASCTSGTATNFSIETLISTNNSRCNASLLDGQRSVFLRRSCVRRSHPCSPAAITKPCSGAA